MTHNGGKGTGLGLAIARQIAVLRSAPEHLIRHLGLAIAREIVVKHGGSLTLVNRPGVGATFWMHLPAAPPSASAHPIAG